MGHDLCPLHFYIEDGHTFLTTNLPTDLVLVFTITTVRLVGPHLAGLSIVAWHAGTSLRPVHTEGFGPAFYIPL